MTWNKPSRQVRERVLEHNQRDHKKAAVLKDRRFFMFQQPLIWKLPIYKRQYEAYNEGKLYWVNIIA